MSDFVEDMRALDSIRRENKASLREQAPEELRRAGILFEVKNLGAHLIVEGRGGYIDFWPGTGKWSVRGGAKGFGISNLINMIKGQ